LSTLAALILRMEDLRDQENPQALHRLSIAKATRVAGLACLSAAQVPTSRLRRELNFRNVPDRRGSALAQKMPNGRSEGSPLMHFLQRAL